MALNFPSSPTVGQIHYDTNSGFYYEWDGTVWKSYSPSSTSQIKVLDDISSSFDDVTTTFALTSNSVALSPVNPQQLIINLGGVIQDPSSDYTVSGSNIEFTTAPQSGLTFSGVSLGPAINLTLTNITSTNDTTTNSEFYPVFVDGTSETSPTISTSKLTFNPSTGILRVDKSVIGSATTFTEDLVVQGDARVTDILTIGTGTLTIDSFGNINATGIITASHLNVDGNVSIAGTLTYEDVTNVDSIGMITARSGIQVLANGIDVSGIVTASSANFDSIDVGSAVTINSTGVYTIAGIVTAFDFDTLSDINYKENVETVDNALDIVSDLRGVKFDWKETRQPSYGVIAQELEEVLPELVRGDNPKVVNYNGIIGVLIEAIKELKQEIKDLKTTK